MAEDEISADGKKARFARWDEIGLDRVKADLLSGGHQLIGGPPSVRNLAWEWVWAKEAEQAKISDAAVRAKPAAECSHSNQPCGVWALISKKLGVVQ
jgi:hypothetical protein